MTHRKHFVLLISILVILYGCNKPAREKPPIKIAVIGSSIGAGVGATDISLSWVAEIQRQNPDSHLLNFSKSGATTYHFLPEHYSSTSLQKNRPVPLPDVNIDQVIKHAPKIIIISITTNDIARGFSPEEYMNNMEIIVDRMRNAGISFIITSTTLRNDVDLTKKKALLRLYYNLRSAYLDRFVDIMTPLADTSRLSIYPHLYNHDRIHPNDDGHAKIATQVNKVLQRFK